MKNTVIALFAAFFAFAFASCKKITGDGPVVTTNRNVTGYHAIRTGVDGDIYFTQDSNYSLEIRAQQNILNILDTKVVGGELVIGYNYNHNIGNHERIIIYVSAPDINALTVSGSGKLNVTRRLNAADLALRISGSGSLSIPDITARNVSMTISGSGDIGIAAGSAQTANAEISGSGDIDALDMQAMNVDARISGSGTARVHATNQLDVHISGSGNVIYKGHPKVSSSISGSGRVQSW